MSSTLGIYVGALADVVRRYATAFGDAWSRRHQLDPEPRPRYEVDFLPAHLELMDTPIHPAPMWTARVLLVLVGAVIVLCSVCRLDIVATAPGKLIPVARIKVVQSAGPGVVRRILVRNGQVVTGGEELVELDPVQALADSDKTVSAKITAQLAIARAHALLEAQNSKGDPAIAPVPGAAQELQVQTQVHAGDQIREYRAKVASLDAELAKRHAEYDTTEAEITKLEQTLPLARAQARDYKELLESKYVASHDYQEKERVAIEQTQELAAQRSHLAEIAADIRGQAQEIETTRATFTRELYETLEKAQADAKQAEDDQTKADERRRLLTLRAPVSGIVQQLEVHTVGGVVTTAQKLMEIVPNDALEVEATVSNRDIGFVNAGQRAVVKLYTFPYTRYGYLLGTVAQVSNSAIQDQKLGPVFLARIIIPSNRFWVGTKWVDLTPGMEVSTEIRTGTQTVWQYFLRPLIETGHESLRER